MFKPIGPSPAVHDRMNMPVIFGLFAVHFIGDIYMSFINPLLPALADKLSLSLAQVGMVTGISMVTAFVIQPLVGYLADRYSTRAFVLGGPLLTALFIPLFGWAWSLFPLLVFATLGSIGQSMFHPPATGMVPAHAGRRLGFSMALFILGGTVAFGLGPVLVAWYVSRLGLEKLPWLSIPGVAVVAVLFLVIPRPDSERLGQMGFWGSIKGVLGPVWQPLLVIFAVIVFRIFVVQTFLTFVPLLLTEEGHSLVLAGGVISVFVVAGSISSVLAGHLADRVGYKPVFLASYILATPCLLLFLQLQGTWLFFGAFLAGFFSLATIPVATALAQTLVQKGQALVASLTMGLAFGTGGLLSPLTGKLGDIYTLRPVLTAIFVIPILASILVKYLPEFKQAEH